MKSILMAVAICLSTQAHGKSVESQVEQLKANSENAESNFKQYQENHEIAKSNVETTQKAIQDLDTQRAQLQKNVQNIDGNKAALQKMREHVVGLQTKEREAAKTDETRIEEVKALLTRLEASKRGHETNIATYENKLAEMDQEKAGWDQQKSAVADLTAAIDTKKTEAVTAQKTWKEKAKTYGEQITRWKSESEKASKQYREVSSLK